MFIEGEIPNVVTTTGSNSGYGNGFGGDWIWAFLIFALLGWGRNGFGGGSGYGNGGIGENYALVTDVATLERKMDTIQSGICDSTYALNNTMTNGFAGLQSTLCQGFSGVNLGLTTQGYETRGAITDLGYAVKDCCCQQLRAVDGVNFNIATQFGSLNNTLCNLSRDIIDNQNANYRAIHEELIANRIEAKNERIAEQQNEINALRLKASQEAQNNYLISELKPCPKPAFITCNPYQSYPYFPAGYGCGCSSVQ